MKTAENRQHSPKTPTNAAPRQYGIGAFARLSRLSIHTLRYYEKEGLLKPARDSSNRRAYAEADLAWTDFIKRLKATNMPIKNIRLYSEMRAAGSATLRPRLELLLAHRKKLQQTLQELRQHQEHLEAKIAFYQKELEKQEGRG